MIWVWFGTIDPLLTSMRLRREEKGVTHSSGIVFFIIVSLPEDAAETICCSIELLTFAVSSFGKKGVSPLAMAK